MDNSNQDTHDDASLPRIDASGSTLPPESGRLALESLAVNIPHDQMRMIHNINALISEVINIPMSIKIDFMLGLTFMIHTSIGLVTF